MRGQADSRRKRVPWASVVGIVVAAAAVGLLVVMHLIGVLGPGAH